MLINRTLYSIHYTMLTQRRAQKVFLHELTLKVFVISRPDQHSVKTDVAEPTQNPMWNATLEFCNVPGEDLMERTIEVTLWDYCPDKDAIFLGNFTTLL